MVSRISAFTFATLLVSGIAYGQPAANCEVPNVLVLLDVSGSMKKVVGSKTKMEQAVDAVDTMLSPNERNAKFGLSLFPAPGTGACSVSTSARVPFKVQALADFRSNLKANGSNYFGGAQANSDTPIEQALQSAQSMFPAISARQFVILVTDGKQDCCLANDNIAETDHVNCPGDGNGTNNSTADSTSKSEEARYEIARIVGEMKAQNITVFPVGFSGQSDAKTLNLIAQAAGTERFAGCDPEGTSAGSSSNCYYHANDEDALADALSTIVRKIQEEVCDGLDNDCDNRIDEGADDYSHLVRSCGLPTCGAGTQQCTAPTGSGKESWSECQSLQVSTEETCNGIDDDCDRQIDEGLVRDCSNCLGAGTITCVGKNRWSVCSAPTLSSPTDCDPKPATPRAVESAPAPMPTAAPVPVVEEVPAKRVTVKGGCDCQNTSATQGLASMIAIALLTLVPRRKRR